MKRAIPCRRAMPVLGGLTLSACLGVQTLLSVLSDKIQRARGATLRLAGKVQEQNRRPLENSTPSPVAGCIPCDLTLDSRDHLDSKVFKTTDFGEGKLLVELGALSRGGLWTLT